MPSATTTIGETQEQVFERAIKLRDAGKIANIEGSPGSRNMPDWWNNSITLQFRDGRLVEIYRFRFCCELP